MTERVVENLNRGLDTVLETYPRALLLGEDILDPYGGAFQATRGLSSKFPERVIGTPISEQAIVAIANGLALSGELPIVEIMFGDFLSLAFDQILNISSKVPEMNGSRDTHQMIIRAPYGGHRGYGSTHSQSLQKHFLGIPNISLYEMSPFHDMGDVFLAMIQDGIPALHFESKVLYPKRVINADRAYDIFDLARLGGENDFVVLTSSNQIQTDLVIICPGGLVHDAMTVARNQMIEKERETTIVVPSKLYPFDLEPIISICEKARQIVVIEEGIIGGSWGDTLVRSLYTKIWRQISNPILVIGSRDFAIPSARHLEEKVLINSTRIEELINEASYS